MLVKLHGSEGDQWLITSLHALAQVAANPPEGGWEIVEFIGLGKLSKDEAEAVLRYTRGIAIKMTPVTAPEWETVAHCAINSRAV